MPRLVIVLPLPPLREGDSFAVKDWPLHITVLAPFHTDAEPAAVAAVIASVAAVQPALTVRAGHDELFGRRQNVPVTVIDEHEPLVRLHDALVAAVRPLATSPHEPAFTGPEYRPHITIKGDNRVHEGEEFTLGQIALVDMAPRAAASGRTVLAAFPLSG